jgi:16S rRNA (cytosine1402-N4)-methyltransferase
MTLRSTPAGQHRPVLLNQVLAALEVRPGEVIADCTVGWAGHAVELLRRVGPEGRLIGIDTDPGHLSPARERLAAIGPPFSLHHGNFAGLAAVLAQEGVTAVDALLADLGMSSMQVDDPDRGFSYVRDGPLDMRMDTSRGRTAAQLLATVSEQELSSALKELGDEPEAATIARAIIAHRQRQPLERTSQLAQVVQQAIWKGKGEPAWRLRSGNGKWNQHPAARTFQALRILVNRELANLGHLLRLLPEYLKPGGRAAIISFHSGEDRLVKAAFRAGKEAGVYMRIAEEPERATFAEKASNPRSRSAKLRWARRAKASSGPQIPCDTPVSRGQRLPGHR